MYYISYILDESGSMSSVKSETISGFNEYIDSLKNKKLGNSKFYFTKFNGDAVTDVYSGVDIDFVGKLTESNYKPNSMTPLYDAVGNAINRISKKVEPFDKVLFVIQTDGYENTSKEYTISSIKSLIESKKIDGWDFVFLGSDIDSKVGSDIGIYFSFTYSSGSTREMYKNLSNVTVNYANTGSFTAPADWSSVNES